MCLQILLHTMKEWFGHSNCQSTFFFVIRKRRIQKWFLPILPLIQSQGEKILNKSLLRERSMIVQIGFHLLEHFLRGLDCQSPLLLFCGGWLLDFIAPARIQQRKKTINYKREARRVNREREARGYNYKCAVCGRTDADYPNLQFRYCSRCQGYHCFCEDHINNHIHFTS